LLLCVRAILPAKAVAEMTYTVSGGMLNPTHSLIIANFIPTVHKMLRWDQRSGATFYEWRG